MFLFVYSFMTSYWRAFIRILATWKQKAQTCKIDGLDFCYVKIEFHLFLAELKSQTWRIQFLLKIQFSVYFLVPTAVPPLRDRNYTVLSSVSLLTFSGVSVHIAANLYSLQIIFYIHIITKIYIYIFYIIIILLLLLHWYINIFFSISLLPKNVVINVILLLLLYCCAKRKMKILFQY